MPINERGEFVRDRPRPSSAATGSEGGNSGGENSSSRGWVGRAVLSMLVLFGASAIWNYMSGSEKSTPPSTTARGGEQNVPAASAPSVAVTPVGQNVQFSNTCSQPVKVYVSYTMPDGSENTGIYDFSPGHSSYLGEQGKPIRIRAVGEIFYFAKMTSPDRTFTWRGKVEKFVEGTSYRMTSATIGSTEVKLSVSCPNFWRVAVKNLCHEEVRLAIRYKTLVPDIPFTIGAWWVIAPAEEKILKLEGGDFVEIGSESPSTPGEFYYYGKSLSYEWVKRDSDEGRMVWVDGEQRNMRLHKLTPGSQGPHLNLTCT